MIIKSFLNIFKSNKNSKKFYPQTFTYFIPAPKQNRSAYREKHFDQVFRKFVSKGFDVIDIKTQSSGVSEVAGLWIIVLATPLNESAENVSMDEFEPEILDTIEDPSKDTEIDGLYYIEPEGQPDGKN